MCICVHINIKTYKQENNKTLKVVRVTLRQSVLPLSVPLWAAWQRYRSVSPHLDLNLLFVETYQITLIWYVHTRPLQSLVVNLLIFLGGHKPLSYSLTFIYSLFGGHSLS